MGMLRYTSCTSMERMKSPSLIDTKTDYGISKEKGACCRKLFRADRSTTEHHFSEAFSPKGGSCKTQGVALHFHFSLLSHSFYFHLLGSPLQ